MRPLRKFVWDISFLFQNSDAAEKKEKNLNNYIFLVVLGLSQSLCPSTCLHGGGFFRIKIFSEQGRRQEKERERVELHREGKKKATHSTRGKRRRFSLQDKRNKAVK